jgi:hypothetical protein
MLSNSSNGAIFGEATVESALSASTPWLNNPDIETATMVVRNMALPGFRKKSITVPGVGGIRFIYKLLALPAQFLGVQMPQMVPETAQPENERLAVPFTCQFQCQT